jgi:hypothetical protein
VTGRTGSHTQVRRAEPVRRATQRELVVQSLIRRPDVATGRRAS